MSTETETAVLTEDQAIEQAILTGNQGQQAPVKEVATTEATTATTETKVEPPPEGRPGDPAAVTTTAATTTETVDPLKDLLLQYQLDQDKLPDVLKTHAEQASQLQALRAENEALKSKKAEPEFETEQQQKAYDFISKHFKNAKLDEGLRSYARLMDTDVSKLEGKDALRELYVLENSDLNRQDALELFEEDYETKYEANPGRTADIRLSRDTSQAKAKLDKLIAEFKARTPESIPGEDTAVTQSIQASQVRLKEEWGKAVNTFSTHQLIPDVLKEEPMNIGIDEADRKQLQTRMEAVLSNPDFYDDNGGFYGGFDAEKTRKEMAFGLIGLKTLSSVAKHYYERGKEARVKEISGQQPTRTSTGAPAVNGPKNEAEAIEQAILAQK